MGMSNRRGLFLLMVLTLVGGESWSQSTGVIRSLPMSVNTATSGESAASAPASGMVTRSGNSTVTFKLINNCFPTNLRGVTNPLAPNSTIAATIKLKIGSREYTLQAIYPGLLVTQQGLTGGSTQANPTVSSIPAGATGAIYGNTVIINTPFPSTVSIDSTGVITDSDKGDVYLESANFYETVLDCSNQGPVYGSLGWSSQLPTYACGEFMGKTGDVTATVGGLSVSSDKSNIELNVSFPGQTGFCGGYWSPLMVFFDDARPKFTNISEFPLNPFGKTYWPEKNAPGYFVAIDRDGSGKIDKKNELFGDNGSVKNGFEVLKEFDSNHDGVIDSRDRDFDKLVLWQDKNGDGISQPEEIVKLSSKVQKISLNYKNDKIIPLGTFAEARQYSTFWYKNAKGKVKKGSIVDVWLGPVLDTKVSAK